LYSPIVDSLVDDYTNEIAKKVAAQIQTAIDDLE